MQCSFNGRPNRVTASWKCAVNSIQIELDEGYVRGIIAGVKLKKIHQGSWFGIRLIAELNIRNCFNNINYCNKKN